ncbi:MAG: hypothetical protein OXC05_01685 [Halieaceae bacterium]|nr:hypothetical protein [Halieaceae bacterium]
MKSENQHSYQKNLADLIVFQRYRETAEQFAFLLNQLGVETLSASE